jgi:hypothetical protein
LASARAIIGGSVAHHFGADMDIFGGFAGMAVFAGARLWTWLVVVNFKLR